MGDRKERGRKREKGEDCNSLHDLENNGNLVLRVEEAKYQAP